MAALLHRAAIIIMYQVHKDYNLQTRKCWMDIINLAVENKRAH